MADQSTGTDTIGCAQRLRLGTWNCVGLSYTQRVLCDELGYDVLGLTETHDTGRLTASRRFVLGEPAPAGDSASYGAPFSHLFTELKISPNELKISSNELEISPIQLMNWRYLQFN